MLSVSISWSELLFLSWYVRSSSTAYTFKPELVLVEAIRLTITSELVRGLPFQLILINENSLCSIVFHLLARLRLRPTSREGLRLITEVIYTSVIAVCLDGEVDLKSERQPEPLP